MNLAALIDLGVPLEWLRAELARLPITEKYQLQVSQATKMGITGTHLKVIAEHGSEHRHHTSIVEMIKSATYPAATEARALAMFLAIARAEAKIHNIPVDEVHFHEVGAIDSIVDIVGAALAIEYLEPETILSNPVELGGGFVDCAHGRFPVPAPATQELLSGVPCTYGGVDGESTTPTGAAILASNVNEFSPRGQFTPTKVGYGVGFKDFKLPNVVRVVQGDYAPETTDAVFDQQVVIEANIDDMTPESYEPLMQSLFAAGASDVWVTPIIMKKSRPAHTLAALCPIPLQDQVSDVMLNHSTTIGLRITPFSKRMLPREVIQFDSSLGTISVKVVIQPDGLKRGKPEHDELMAIAAERQIDYRVVKNTVEAELLDRLRT